MTPDDRSATHLPAEPAARTTRDEVAELKTQNAALVAQLAELRTGYRALQGNARLRATGTTNSTSFAPEERGPGMARSGRLTTPRGEIATPAYLPSAPRGALTGLTPEVLSGFGARGLAVNLLELSLQPGADIIESSGGLARTMVWPRPIFGDTGTADLAAIASTRVGDDAIEFRGRLDGSKRRWDPEEAVRVAHQMGVDVAFALAAPTRPGASAADLSAAVNRTHSWAGRAMVEHSWLTSDRGDQQSLWAVVTGGTDAQLRRDAVRGLRNLAEQDVIAGGLGFGGYRIDGIDSAAQQSTLILAVTEQLGWTSPRYLPAIGGPADLLAAIAAGVDLVDSPAAARLAAAGTIFTVDGPIDITDPQYRADFRPLDPNAERPGAPNRVDQFTRAYVHHLFAAKEGLAVTLSTLHNEHFLVSLAHAAREAIGRGSFGAYAESTLRRFGMV